MVLFVLAREQRVPHIEFVKDTAEAPHVDGCVVGDAQHDFWGSVESGLNVGVDLFVLEAAAAEVDYLDARLVYFSQQDVFGLQVAVDDGVLAEVVEGNENLDGESLDEVEGETLEVVHLDELVQVDREHLERYHQVLPEHELVESPDDVLFVFRIPVVQVLDQLGFDQTLLV